MVKKKIKNKQLKTGVGLIIFGIILIIYSRWIFYNISTNNWLSSLSSDFGFLGLTSLVIGIGLAVFHKKISIV